MKYGRSSHVLSGAVEDFDSDSATFCYHKHVLHSSSLSSLPFQKVERKRTPADADHIITKKKKKEKSDIVDQIEQIDFIQRLP